MATQPNYKSLPFSWKSKSKETIESDRRWLESIIRNAAPFSDWWTKARIVQLAYVPRSQEAAERETYAGLFSEAAIVQALRGMCDLDLHPCFASAVNEEYAIKTLNSWCSERFSTAVARNFEVYADRCYENVFLVTSTATVTLDVDRQLPPPQRYRALFNVNELAWIVRDSGCHHLTVRTHGYASPAKGFFQGFAAEAKVLNRVTPVRGKAQQRQFGQRRRPKHAGSLATPVRVKGETPARGFLSNASPLNGGDLGTRLAPQHFYIGYQWPSEKPIVGPELWFDFRHNLGIAFKFLFVLSGVSGIVGTVLYAILQLVNIGLLKVIWHSFSSQGIWAWGKANMVAATQFNWLGIVGSVFLLWALLFHLLRILAYQRDRNRVMNYAAPDLAEFFWRLDKALGEPSYWPQTPAVKNLDIEQFKQYTLRVNLIGHSMGALVMVGLLRILSDKFGQDDQKTVLPDFIRVPNSTGEDLVSRGDDSGDRIGQYLQLDKLILPSPDIPLEFIREGRNNYVRSAISRCRQLYLMSSDRDIVLRYLSTLGNWFSEPSLAMSGLRLGNVFLQPLSTKTSPQYHPVLRNLIGWRSVATATSAYDLFEKFNYLDCSEVPGLNGINLALTPYTGVLIDLINMALYFSGRIDVHGAYFWTNTPTFEILKFLIATDDESDIVCSSIERLIANTPIRFLPSQPFLSKNLHG